MDSWSGSDWICSLLSFKSPLSFCKQKSARWSEQKGGISIFIRCWLQDFFSPPLSLSPSPFPWMNLETQTHRVAWLAGFILFSGLIWPGWSVFQIAEEDSVTESHRGAAGNCYRRSTSQTVLQALKKSTGEAYLVLLWIQANAVGAMNWDFVCGLLAWSW